MEAFPVDNRGKGVRNLDLHCDSLSSQCLLGVFWDLKNDSFTFQVTLPDKPFTRRGLDASKDAIRAAIYLRQVNDRGKNCTALVFGQSRVTPVHITSISRLELCAVVLVAQAVNKITKEIDIEIDKATFYTNSKVVLGYIQNESQRFYVYMANHVQLICKMSRP